MTWPMNSPLVGKPLTPREEVILAELVKPDTLRAIARRLNRHEGTIRNMTRWIYLKHGVANRDQLREKLAEQPL